jgi:hypothetical protein
MSQVFLENLPVFRTVLIAEPEIGDSVKLLAMKIDLR